MSYQIGLVWEIVWLAQPPDAISSSHFYVEERDKKNWEVKILKCVEDLGISVCVES